MRSMFTKIAIVTLLGGFLGAIIGFIFVYWDLIQSGTDPFFAFYAALYFGTRRGAFWGLIVGLFVGCVWFGLYGYG